MTSRSARQGSSAAGRIDTGHDAARIGAVAARLGMPASTIRYYEKIGLIERQRRVSGRRTFDARAVQMLRFVQLAQAAGFSIAEIKGLRDSYAKDPSPAGMWQPFAEARRAAVRQQVRRLRRMDRVLTRLLSCECATLADCLQAAEAADRRGIG